MNIKSITKISVVAALYATVSLAIAPISFGMIQLRVSDMLLLLCLYDKKYVYSNAIGVFIVNLFSPLGLIDVAVGTIAQIICGCSSYVLKNKWIYSFTCSLIIGLMIGSEMYFVYGGLYWLNVASVIISTIIVLAVGCTLQSVFKLSKKRGNRNV